VESRWLHLSSGSSFAVGRALAWVSETQVRGKCSHSKLICSPMVLESDGATTGSFVVIGDPQHLSPSKLAGTTRARILAGQSPPAARERQHVIVRAARTSDGPNEEAEGHTVADAMEDHLSPSSRVMLEDLARCATPASSAPPEYTERPA
jgi:hypothetical protein